MNSKGMELLDERLTRYDRPLFRDHVLQDEVRRAGFAIVDSVLADDDLRALTALAQQVRAEIRTEFLTVARLEDPLLRSRVMTAGRALIEPRLRSFFVQDVDILGSVLLLKPPTEDSQLNSHQDASLVDEADQLGVYAWIPLTDTNQQNGGLAVVPGSHRILNRQRTLNVPWQLDPFGEILDRYSKPLTVPAGAAVFIDAAMVHSSPPNYSTDLRIATNSFVKHGDSPLLHFFVGPKTPAGLVEVFEIDVRFFLECRILERPPAPYRSLGLRPLDQVLLSAEEFEHVCVRACDEAQ